MENEEKYTMPDEIREKIPPEFYSALFGEIVSVFGFRWLVPDKYLIQPDKPDFGYTDMVSRYLLDIHITIGWDTAFNQACRKLSLKWLEDYEHYGVSGYDRETFDYELSEEMIKHFCLAKKAPDYRMFVVRLEKEKLAEQKGGADNF